MDKIQFLIQFRLPQRKTWYDCQGRYKTPDKARAVLARVLRKHAESPVKYRAVRRIITTELLDE